MPIKTYVGEVLVSEANEFTSAKGELVKLWKFGIQISETSGKVFNVSEQNLDLYEKIRGISKGTVVECDAHSEIGNDGSIKWKLDDVIIRD